MKPQKDKVLKKLKKIFPALLEKYGVTKIGIFGSVARNEACEGSDIDIVYEMRKPNIFTVVHMKRDLEQVLDFSVDLVRYRKTLNPFLKKRIEKDGIYVR